MTAVPDKTGQVLDDIRKEWATDKLRIFHLSKSVGKKQAIEVASKIARGDVYAFMDSDCDMAHDAIEKASQDLRCGQPIRSVNFSWESARCA